MSYNEEKRRASGRTSRMLQEAVELARDGKAVYVVCATQRHTKQLEKRVPDDLDIKFETPRTVGNLDWRNMRLEGAHSNVELLVDHYAIEANWRPLLNMLHRFDKSEK